MSSETTESGGRGSGLGWIILALVLLPVLYVLSAGPAVAIVDRTGRGEDALEVGYAPLDWLHRHTPLRQSVTGTELLYRLIGLVAPQFVEATAKACETTVPTNAT